jgi:beta-phosphoglucomutase
MHNPFDRHRRAVLWDVDGTLLDSSDYHWWSWRETMADQGVEITRQQFVASFGQRNDTILRTYFGPDFPDDEIARIADRKEARYRELMQLGGVEPLPGVVRWLQHLQRAGWQQAIASSAPRANVDAIVAALGLAPFFAAIVTAEDVQRGKPDPQVFLTAAARLGVPPRRCVVIEDAPAGIQATHRGGMRAIGVLSSHPTLAADIAVRTLDELPDDTFDRLVED